MPTKVAKEEVSSAYRFDAVSFLGFDNVATIGAAVAQTTVQARLLAPTRMKIAKVGVNYSAIAATTGTHLFNIVLGNGAYTAGNVVPDDTGRYVGPLAQALPGGIAPTSPGVNGQALFAANQPLTSAADAPAVFIPTNYDGIIEQGTLLTLRVVTPASTGSITNLKVVLAAIAVDPYAGQAPGYSESTWAVPSAVPVVPPATGW